MKNIKGCMLSTNVDWSTPKNIYNYYCDQGYLDPCPLYSCEDNLKKVYHNSKLFINPPFCDLDKWTDFIINNMSVGLNNDIVLLMPARTDTIYFHKLLSLKPTITFLRGRLKFGNSNKPAPFPTILLSFSSFPLLSLYNTKVF